MKIGKVSESVLKRSILKEIKNTKEEILIGAGVGEDCAVLTLKEDEVFVVSTDPVTGATKDIGMLAVNVAVNDLAASGAEPVGLLICALLPEEITEDIMENSLDTAGLPAPDLLIRTCNEQRISNFLLWQAAYAELYFTDTLWPDMTEHEVAAAIESFSLRKRRYGGLDK